MNSSTVTRNIKSVEKRFQVVLHAYLTYFGQNKRLMSFFKQGRIVVNFKFVKFETQKAYESVFIAENAALLHILCISGRKCPELHKLYFQCYMRASETSKQSSLDYINRLTKLLWYRKKSHLRTTTRFWRIWKLLRLLFPSKKQMVVGMMHKKAAETG